MRLMQLPAAAVLSVWLASAAADAPPPPVPAATSAPAAEAIEPAAPRRSAAAPALPLGLIDVETLLGRAQAALDGATTPTQAAQADLAATLTLAVDYLRRVAAVDRSRIRYQWIPLGRTKIEPAVDDADELDPSDPVPGAAALRFRALGGNIRVVEVVLHGSGGRTQTYRPDLLLEADLPKREALFFREAIEIRRVFVTARHDGRGSRRLELELGVPDRPEYAREGALHGREALEALETARYAPARAALGRALEQVRRLTAPPAR